MTHGHQERVVITVTGMMIVVGGDEKETTTVTMRDAVGEILMTVMKTGIDEGDEIGMKIAEDTTTEKGATTTMVDMEVVQEL